MKHVDVASGRHGVAVTTGECKATPKEYEAISAGVSREPSAEEKFELIKRCEEKKRQENERIRQRLLFERRKMSWERENNEKEEEKQRVELK